MQEPFALGELARLRLDTLMVLESGLQVVCQAFARGRTHVGGALEIGVGIGRPSSKGLTQRQQMAFGLTHDFDEDAALAPTLAAKATHGFLEASPQDVALGSQHPNLGWSR